MSELFYDLEGNQISQAAWSKVFRSGKGRVKRTRLKSYDVSTTWTGLNFFGDEETPMIYETMVFRSESYDDVFCERYPSREKALEAHGLIAERAENGEFDTTSE